MSRSLILVLKNKGGVGATTVATLLCDFLDVKANRFRVFDGQVPNGSLKRRFPEAELVAFATTQGRERVLDGLGEYPTLVDIPADLGSETIQLLSDIGFLEEVTQAQAKLAVVHVLAPNADSLSEATEIGARLPAAADHYLVKNCVTDDEFVGSGDFKSRMASLGQLKVKGIAEIGHLDGQANKSADDAGGTFMQYALNPENTYTRRRLVQKWAADAFKSFDKAGMRALAIG